MDKRCLFSAFSLAAVFIYMYIGCYTYNLNKKSYIHRAFLLLCTSYAIWSFAYAFAYVSSDRRVFSFWNKISAVGWCSFSAISLLLVLLITDNKIVKKRPFRFLIFSPSAVFLFMAIFLFGEDINTPPMISSIFYIGNFLYNFIFLLVSIITLFIWGLKTDKKRIKIQSKILVLASIIPFGLNLLTQTILPIIGVSDFPLMGQLYSVIVIIASYIVITKYKFLKLPDKIVFDEVANKMMDFVILVNEKGEFIKISKHALEILGFKKNELMQKNINDILEKTNNEEDSISQMGQSEKQYNDVKLLKKNGETIPVNIVYVPIFDTEIHDFLGAALIMQDISIIHELKCKNEELEQRVIRDSLTNLYNHQYSIELVKREVDQANAGVNPKELSVLMVDIDYFKSVNDTYGHPFGDYVIKTVSNILSNIVRETGYVGRFGGEEFIIILPQTGINNAYQIGEEIRNEVENYKFDNDLNLTISIGIKKHMGESSVTFVKHCDALLYSAKQNGRNRIEFSSR